MSIHTARACSHIETHNRHKNTITTVLTEKKNIYLHTVYNHQSLPPNTYTQLRTSTLDTTSRDQVPVTGRYCLFTVSAKRALFRRSPGFQPHPQPFLPHLRGPTAEAIEDHQFADQRPQGVKPKPGLAAEHPAAVVLQPQQDGQLGRTPAGEVALRSVPVGG